jgi:hypothetical protein
MKMEVIWSEAEGVMLLVPHDVSSRTRNRSRRSASSVTTTESVRRRGVFEAGFVGAF